MTQIQNVANTVCFPDGFSDSGSDLFLGTQKHRRVNISLQRKFCTDIRASLSQIRSPIDAQY